MKIGIDARLLGERGLGRYIEQLISHLENIDKENQYYVFLTKENFEKYNPKSFNFEKVLADYKWYGFAEQFLFPMKLKQYNLKLVHFPHFNVPFFYRKPFVVTLHDLIVLKFPTIRATTLAPIIYNLKKIFLKIIVKSAIKRAKKIISISEFTKNDVIEYFNLNTKHASKIETVYEGTTRLEVKEYIGSNSININMELLKPYIIYVGSAYPHKNIEKLCEAFKQIHDLKLVLVGKKDYFYKRLEVEYQDLIGNKLIFTDYLTDDQVAYYMKNALFYVFPSLYEGFGLPPLEAMQQGLPVLSSNASCLPEILKDSVEYFDPTDVNSIANSINNLKNNTNKLNDLKIRSELHYRRYSWQECAKKTLEIYESSIIKKKRK